MEEDFNIRLLKEYIKNDISNLSIIEDRLDMYPGKSKLSQSLGIREKSKEIARFLFAMNYPTALEYYYLFTQVHIGSKSNKICEYCTEGMKEIIIDLITTNTQIAIRNNSNIDKETNVLSIDTDKAINEIKQFLNQIWDDYYYVIYKAYFMYLKNIHTKSLNDHICELKEMVKDSNEVDKYVDTLKTTLQSSLKKLKEKGETK